MTAITVAALALAVLLAVALVVIINLLDERDAAQAETRALRRQLDWHERSNQ